MPSPRKVRGKPNKSAKSVLKSAQSSVLSWRTPQFHFFPKSSLWAVSALAFTITFAYGLFLFNYFALSSIVLLGGLTLILVAQQRPKLFEHRVDKKGVWIGGHLVHWVTLRSFWTVPSPHSGGQASYDKLYLETTNRVRPRVTVLIPRGKHKEIRDHLSRHLPEHPTRGEVFSETLTRILRI